MVARQVTPSRAGCWHARSKSCLPRTVARTVARLGDRRSSASAEGLDPPAAFVATLRLSLRAIRTSTVFLAARKSMHSARGVRVRVSVNASRARRARARGFDRLPSSLPDVATLSF
jgi:hypothetical protein